MCVLIRMLRNGAQISSNVGGQETSSCAGAGGRGLLLIPWDLIPTRKDAAMSFLEGFATNSYCFTCLQPSICASA